MYVISFDLSSSTVGYTIYEKDTKKLVKISYFKYSKDVTDLLDKGKELEEFITLLTNEYQVDQLIIEERLKKFAGGQSSINNILVLAQLNYICQYMLKFKFNIKLKEINVLKARGLVFPEIFKVTRATKEKQKDYVFSKVKAILKDVEWPSKVVSRGKNKGNTEYLEECKDMSDAWVIMQAHFLQEK